MDVNGGFSIPSFLIGANVVHRSWTTGARSRAVARYTVRIWQLEFSVHALATPSRIGVWNAAFKT